MNEGAEKEKRRSDAERYSHGNDTYERRGETEFCTQFFVQLFLKKADECRGKMKFCTKFFAQLSFKKADGGRGETKFRIKFFAQLSFKKAGGR